MQFHWQVITYGSGFFRSSWTFSLNPGLTAIALRNHLSVPCSFSRPSCRDGSTAALLAGLSHSLKLQRKNQGTLLESFIPPNPVHEDNIATFSRQLEVNHGPFRHISTILHMLKQLLSRARNPLQVGSVAASDPSTRASLLLFLYRRRRFYFIALIFLIITGSLSTCLAYNIKISSIIF